jgi:protein TonB
MLGVLLESRARVQRRNGGMALSVATHAVLIGLATAATVRGAAVSPDKPKVEVVVFKAPPKPTPPEPKRAPTPVLVTVTSAPTVPTISIVPPDVIPPTLPPINSGGTPTPDDFVVTRGGSGGHGGPPSLIDEGPQHESSDWRGSEVLMHILTQAKPRYPESLRSAGVDGTVLVQFNVDTLGRVDMPSVKILSSTHDLFSGAVRQSLGAMRFKPAEVNGKRVTALAQMPFEFHLNK